MKKRTASIFLVAVLLISLAGAFFVYPNSLVSWFNKVSPWKLGLDIVGGAHLTYRVDTSQLTEVDVGDTISGLRDVIERRINLFGVREPQVAVSQTGGEYYIVVELSGISDLSQAINEIGSTPYLDFREVVGEGESAQYVPTGLNGRHIKSARLDFNQTTGQSQVALEMNKEGADLFEQITERNVGRIVGIFLDGSPISQPRVNEKITGGQAVITGDFTLKEAKSLVERLNAGALPAPITLVDQQTVGASLGKNSLEKSIYAGIIGTVLVVLFMLIYYRFFGLIASLALLIYIILSLSIFKIFVTLSLAGIAGFLLSIGMAVDANVLIFERTKEEIKKGMGRISAIAEGFRRAWPSIRDSNISTIITCLILFNTTSGFVKGLALTLLLGVLISMFTAITVTRSLLTIFVRDKRFE
ncbi:MAG: preprotein translocase subunit SecD, preprotein translocase subunit SecD [Candidatus Wolfebacteria bacterium GW2011_GWC1_43_10]|uniref:Protein translocase subunit SecD n=2 Tax=Candidatus Wolfeibacteriota TaxID=1752735 RepID=A0A0G1EIU4_9BACT|nr:MAG: preprotein translocase subunit SecD, preprotein translocase subunit SecD [Candidatus Wolfebacteria bacterium GW2011_GWC1_43_10]OGM89091.1 MAG: protein-export membrane protein SecD [Candidatus Wolfebacteria bacterium GWA1_42_9]